MGSNQLYAGGKAFFPKSSASETIVLDTYKMTESQETTVQRLLDELADRIINRLLEKTDIPDWARQDSKPSYTAEEVHADREGSARDALMNAKEYSDGTYRQAAAYTDHEIAKLVNGADDTLDTLGEIADAIKNNESVAEALHNAIGAKAADAELQAHMSNGTVHITQGERSEWNAAMSKLSGIDNDADAVSFRQALTSGTKIGAITISGKSFDLYAPENTDTTYSDMKGATTGAAGTHGLVPAPAKGTADRYLRSDGTWQVPPDNNTTYGTMSAATANAPGKPGLVPAPAAGKHNAFLRGDGTWTETVKTLLATNAGLPLDAIVGKILDDKITAKYNELLSKVSEINSNLSGTVKAGSTPTLSALELKSSTPFIDWHFKDSSADYTTRLIEASSGILTLLGKLKIGGYYVRGVNMHVLRLTYKSNSEMYGEFTSTEVPFAVDIDTVDGTPHNAITYATVTKIGTKIKCSAFGAGFVSGHLLAVNIYTIV